MNNFKALIFLVIAGAIACSSPKNEKNGNSDMEISYEIDTVMVDAGDHFFFVRFGLGMSDVDKSRKLLYNFNNQDMKMEIIDLESLSLKEVREYEKEGPNGIGGGFIMRVQVLPDESVLFYDFVGIHHVAKSGEKVTTYKLGEIEWEGDSLSEEEQIDVSSLATKDGKTFYGFYGAQGFDSKTEGIAQFNVVDKSLKLLPSDFLEFISAYDISLQMDGGGMAKSGERKSISITDEKVLIMTSAKNQLWQWDLELDSLVSYPYESQLTSNSKKGNYPVQAGSMEEFRAAITEKNKEVNFGMLVHAPDQDKFWRYHREMERMTAGDTIIYKNVLTAFDVELNQLGEKALPEKFKNTDPVFYLDGMLWQFLNIDDEVAFVRVKPTISE
ncbi:protein of unknown function [Algoriphagus faecimaris]|uniref:DUF4221 domain-containing protein n=1 Tax=Algoriphagus faecimaris TaxID=686796 RepID=A0A1G6NXG1_9BACT|nr:DUF4221 family protein [Algoriphagus faecimaris]SDC72479.1 protein of unknown function [Algoriphagus faecimaris]